MDPQVWRRLEFTLSRDDGEVRKLHPELDAVFAKYPWCTDIHCEVILTHLDKQKSQYERPQGEEGDLFTGEDDEYLDSTG